MPLQAYSTGLGIVDRLAQSDLGNTNWQMLLSTLDLRVGDAQIVQGCSMLCSEGH
jgi:hypothetical protein